MNNLPTDLKQKVELLAATPDELLPVFSPVERAIIQAVKLFSKIEDRSS